MTPIILHGAGREAQAAAEHFIAQGQTPLLYDDGGGTVPGTTPVTLEEAKAALRGAIYLRSPGVPPTNPLVVEAARAAALATTPTGYWLKEYAPPGTITVTGTKGKSTTTALLTSLLKAAGIKSAAYGNIGSPPLSGEPVTETHPVIEVSSYMMHDLPEAEHLHLITSLYKEHADWHGTEADYRAAKLRPFRRKNPANGIAPRSVIDAEHLPPSVIAVEDIVHDQGVNLSASDLEIDVGPRDRGFHAGPLRAALRLSLAAAASIISPSNLKNAAETAATNWRGLPSRQAIIPTTDGKLWVDDTLATIPEATLAALGRFAERDVCVVLGGADRGQDYARLVSWIAEHPNVQAFGIGPAAIRLGEPPVVSCHSLDEAIDRAAKACPPRGVVLFSPAAPSSPPHKSYSERSAVFAAKARSGT
ncbi:MAG: Mur ligase family protein [Pseudomonadota bacterium]